MNFHASTPEETLAHLQSGHEGLSSAEAAERRARFGPNAMEEKPKESMLSRIWAQVKDPMIMILFVAAVISGMMGEMADTIIILAVVIINAIIGLVQENKAQKAIEALKKMSAQHAKVLRDGQVALIDAVNLVPGDLVLLEAGDLVPADLRLLQSANLKIEEASLTGESVPSEKDADAQVPEQSGLGDRTNMAYYGTSVTYGRGRGVVCGIGMTTEMGKIAKMLNETEESQTPLQRKLVEIGKMLTLLVLGICGVIFAVVLLKSTGFNLENAVHAVMIAVSLAVAAIPEGLPAVVTIVMAVGVTRMSARRAIIKRLPAVETLGCAQVICSDKTGTLTQNKMDVRALFWNNQPYSAADFLEQVPESLLYDALYLCNDAIIQPDGTEVGDPTETCLRRFVLQRFDATTFEKRDREDELPFDSQRKMMSTVNRTGEEQYVFSKGAPDELLKRCDRMLLHGEIIPLTDTLRETMMSGNHAMARQALRVLGCAYKPYQTDDVLEQELIFLGLVGMMDPPRPEARDAIETCRKAGITPVMITGDHKDTAIAIAREIGILSDESQAIFGSELDGLSDEQLDAQLDRVRVYSRVAPEHKVRIVEAWKRRGKIVAMTGDGVNDAPALKTADIGVGMGITGTDVSKGVSDMLLADDNFATIVNAVEEGRIIYRNIRKAVQFLLSCNISEVLSLFVATLILPAGSTFLGAVHLLWINLVTDAFPALGLGMDGAEPGIMDEPPRDANKSFFADGLATSILYQGVLMTGVVLLSYFTGGHSTPQEGTTMAFITLSMTQLFHSFNMRTSTASIFRSHMKRNPVLIAAAIVPIVLMVILINVPVLAGWFGVVALPLSEWLEAVGLAFLMIPAVELVKWFQRRTMAKK